jgi:hypothetical protein
MIAPIFAPVIISAAMTSVYIVIAPWIPVTVVPTSFATVAIETFMTELSSVIRNCPAASVRRTSMEPLARSAAGVAAAVVIGPGGYGAFPRVTSEAQRGGSSAVGAFGRL